MTGGAIVAGTYVLTAMDKYNNTSGSNTHRETWVFTATHFDVVIEDSSSGVMRYSGDYSVAGKSSRSPSPARGRATLMTAIRPTAAR